MKINILGDGKYTIGITDNRAIDIVDLNLSKEDIDKINLGASIKILKNGNYKIIENENYNTNKNIKIKEEIIKDFIEKKNMATKLRSEYITAQLLPKGENKNETLELLSSKTESISNEMNLIMTNFKNNFNESILNYVL